MLMIMIGLKCKMSAMLFLFVRNCNFKLQFSLQNKIYHYHLIFVPYFSPPEPQGERPGQEAEHQEVSASRTRQDVPGKHQTAGLVNCE
jgi:hypothetical protein